MIAPSWVCRMTLQIIVNIKKQTCFWESDIEIFMDDWKGKNKMPTLNYLMNFAFQLENYSLHP